MISIVAAICSCFFMPASIICVVPTQAAVFPILNTGQDIISQGGAPWKKSSQPSISRTMVDGDKPGIDVFWFRCHAAMKGAPTGKDAVDMIDGCGASWEVSKIGESMKSGPRDRLEETNDSGLGHRLKGG